MKDNLFDINNFNTIQDEENYYFFRALNMADNNDIEQEITISSDGKIERIRTDRERFNGETKYTEDSKISLEELYDHIKMHYRKDTNCISLTSNANIAINYCIKLSNESLSVFLNGVNSCIPNLLSIKLKI